jgi:hypothetical protein
MTRTPKTHSQIIFKNPLQIARISVPDPTTPQSVSCYRETRTPRFTGFFVYKKVLDPGIVLGTRTLLFT